VCQSNRGEKDTREEDGESAKVADLGHRTQKRERIRTIRWRQRIQQLKLEENEKNQTTKTPKKKKNPKKKTKMKKKNKKQRGTQNPHHKPPLDTKPPQKLIIDNSGNSGQEETSNLETLELSTINDYGS